MIHISTVYHIGFYLNGHFGVAGGPNFEFFMVFEMPSSVHINVRSELCPVKINPIR